MATFGYTTQGGSNAGILANYIYATKGTLTQVADPTSMTVRLTQAAGTPHIKLAIYRSRDGVLKAETIEGTVATGFNSWYTLNFGRKMILPPDEYWLCFLMSGTSTYYYTVTTPKVTSTKAQTYPDFPDPYQPTSYSDRRISMYCTYEVTTLPSVNVIRERRKQHHEHVLKLPTRILNPFIDYLDVKLRDSA